MTYSTNSTMKYKDFQSDELLKFHAQKRLEQYAKSVFATCTICASHDVNPDLKLYWQNYTIYLCTKCKNHYKDSTYFVLTEILEDIRYNDTQLHNLPIH